MGIQATEGKLSPAFASLCFSFAALWFTFIQLSHLFSQPRQITFVFDSIPQKRKAEAAKVEFSSGEWTSQCGSVEFDFRFQSLLILDVNLCFGIGVPPLCWSPSLTWLADPSRSALIFRMTGTAASLSAHPSPLNCFTN